MHSYHYIAWLCSPVLLVIFFLLLDACLGRKRKKRRSWWDEYHIFLKSERWQHIRYQKLCEAGFRCQIKGCTGQMLQVHHLTYRNYQQGNLKDLVVLCHEHHQAVHGRAF